METIVALLPVLILGVVTVSALMIMTAADFIKNGFSWSYTTRDFYFTMAVMISTVTVSIFLIFKVLSI